MITYLQYCIFIFACDQNAKYQFALSDLLQAIDAVGTAYIWQMSGELGTYIEEVGCRK